MYTPGTSEILAYNHPCSAIALFTVRLCPMWEEAPAELLPTTTHLHEPGAPQLLTLQQWLHRMQPQGHEQRRKNCGSRHTTKATATPSLCYADAWTLGCVQAGHIHRHGQLLQPAQQQPINGWDRRADVRPGCHQQSRSSTQPICLSCLKALSQRHCVRLCAGLQKGHSTNTTSFNNS